MYAVGQIPGSFFRSEGRPGEDAILTCRLIDRPLRPTLQEGPAQRGPGRHHRAGARPRPALRRARDQRRVAVHPALRPAVLRPGRRRPRRPDRGPVGRASRRTASSRTPSSTWSSPVGSPTTGDVAIMMVEAESTEQTWNLVARAARRRPPRRSWPAASTPPSRSSSSCARRRPSWPSRPPSRSRSSRSSSTTRTTSTPPSSRRREADLAQALTIAGKQEREARLDEIKAAVLDQLGARVRGSREGARRGVPRR